MFGFFKKLFKIKAANNTDINEKEDRLKESLTDEKKTEDVSTLMTSAQTPVEADIQSQETTENEQIDLPPVNDKNISSYGKFCIKMAVDGTYMFNLKASNGLVIATSQTYTSKINCINGIQSIKNNAPIASIEDKSVENSEVQTHPKFEIYVDKGGSYRFRLKATNGNIIAASQGYSSKSKCKNGIESVKRHAELATIIEEDN
jgi:uncharacterized protein YegP (UPF0339 family)